MKRQFVRVTDYNTGDPLWINSNDVRAIGVLNQGTTRMLNGTALVLAGAGETPRVMGVRGKPEAIAARFNGADDDADDELNLKLTGEAE